MISHQSFCRAQWSGECNCGAEDDLPQGPLQVPVAPNQFQGPMIPINGLADMMWNRRAVVAEQQLQVRADLLAARDATIAELRAEIARLNEANARMSADNADLHRDVTWRADEIARMTLAANAWHQT